MLLIETRFIGQELAQHCLKHMPHSASSSSISVAHYFSDAKLSPHLSPSISFTPASPSEHSIIPLPHIIAVVVRMSVASIVTKNTKLVSIIISWMVKCVHPSRSERVTCAECGSLSGSLSLHRCVHMDWRQQQQQTEINRVGMNILSANYLGMLFVSVTVCCRLVPCSSHK